MKRYALSCATCFLANSDTGWQQLVCAGEEQDCQEDAQPGGNHEAMAGLQDPREAHKMLEATVGNWDAEMRIWMGAPSSEPIVSKGGSEHTMVLGGGEISCRNIAGR